MALLQQMPAGTAQAPQVPADPTGIPQDPAGGEMPGMESVTAEEQVVYDKVVLAGQKVLFEDDKTSAQAVKFLQQQADNPAQAISDYTLILITQLDDQMGNNIPAEVILPASTELMENVSDLADSAGVFPVDDKLMNQAMQLFLPDIAEEYGVEDAEIQEFLSSIDENSMTQAVQVGEGFAATGQPPQEEQPVPQPGVI